MGVLGRNAREGGAGVAICLWGWIEGWGSLYRVCGKENKSKQEACRDAHTTVGMRGWPRSARPIQHAQVQANAPSECNRQAVLRAHTMRH